MKLFFISMIFQLFVSTILNAIEIKSIKDLKGFNKIDNTVKIQSFHLGSNKGGGEFYFDATKSQLEHNGGTIIAKDKLFPDVWNKSNQIKWFSKKGLSGKGCWIRKFSDTIEIEWFGGKGDSISDDSIAIQKTINYAASKHKTIAINSLFGVGSKINLKSNTKLISNKKKFGFKAIAKMPILFKIDKKKNILFENLLIDANNKVSKQLIKAVGVKNLVIRKCELKNWSYGVVINSDTKVPSRQIKLIKNFIHSPTNIVLGGTAGIYPIQINNIHPRPLIEDVIIKNNKVIGVGGSYTAKNSSTADQITLQGVKNFEIFGNLSKDGGEVGITASRLCKNGKIYSNIVHGCDADGIAIGGAYAKITVTDATSFKKGDIIKGIASGAKGKIHVINKNNLYCVSATKAVFKTGEFITINGVQTKQKVINIEITKDIDIFDNKTFNNAKNQKNIKGAWAGIKLQMTDNISIFNNSCYNHNPKFGEGWGIHLTHALNTLIKDNNIKNNKNGDISINGDTTIRNIDK
jgi:hypothetical protein